MPRKAQQTADGSRVTFTIRVAAVPGKWLFERAAAEGHALTEVVVAFIEDARTWWDVAAEMATALREDSEQLNLSQRDYVHYLLERRYEAIRKHGAGWEKDEPAVLLAKRR